MAKTTGELLEYLKIIDQLRERMATVNKAVLAIQKEVEDGERESGTVLEQVEVQYLKDLRTTLIFHLNTIQQMLGDE